MFVAGNSSRFQIGLEFLEFHEEAIHNVALPLRNLVRCITMSRFCGRVDQLVIRI